MELIYLYKKFILEGQKLKKYYSSNEIKNFNNLINATKVILVKFDTIKNNKTTYEFRKNTYEEYKKTYELASFARPEFEKFINNYEKSRQKFIRRYRQVLKFNNESFTQSAQIYYEEIMKNDKAFKEKLLTINDDVMLSNLNKISGTSWELFDEFKPKSFVFNLVEIAQELAKNNNKKDKEK